nr:Transposase [Methylocystis sp. SC2]
MVCLDETSKQLLKETRAPIAMRKGQPRRDELAAWVAARNKHQAKADWQFTADDARVKLKSLYPIFPFKIVESATSAGSKDLAISIG